MERLNNQDNSYGISRPELEYQYKNSRDGTIIKSLTKESEIKWSRYLIEVGLAKIALSKQVQIIE